MMISTRPSAAAEEENTKTQQLKIGISPFFTLSATDAKEITNSNAKIRMLDDMFFKNELFLQFLFLKIFFELMRSFKKNKKCHSKKC